MVSWWGLKINRKAILLFLLIFNCAWARIRFSSKDSGISFAQDNSKLLLSAPILGVTGKITFKDNDPNRVQGDTALDVITFDNGITGTTQQTFKISGTLEPTGVDLVTLRAGESLEIHEQLVMQTVRVVNGFEASITGSPVFTTPVQMGPGAILDLGILNPLTQPLAVEGSNTLKLLSNLTMGLGVSLSNTALSVLNLNGFEFFWNNALSAITSYQGAGTVHFLQGSYLVNSNLNFDGTLNVAGHGSSLLFSPGNSISFGPGLHDLFNIDLKGLDLNATFSVNPLGTVFLSNVTIELAGDLTLANQGQIVVLGNNCKIIPNGHTIRLAGSTQLVVDGVDLLYTPKNPFDPNPFQTVNLGSGSGSIELLNNGRIISTNFGLSIQDNLTVTASSVTATSNWQLTNTSRLVFANATPSVNKPIVYNGGGFYIQFPTGSSTSDLLEIGDNIALTLQNLILKDFNPASISFIGSNSTLQFGTGTELQLSSDKDITSAFKWIFSGNSSIDAAGKTITLKNSGVLEVTNNAALLISNANIKIENPDAIQCLTDLSTVSFQNCSITLNKDGLNLSTGNTCIKGLVQLFGANETDVLGSATLSFSSKGNLLISSHSELIFNRGIVFQYKADPANDGTNTAATKRHFRLSDPSAKLNLNGCCLVSTQTALALDFGTVYVKDRVPFMIDPTPGCEAEFGTDLLVEILVDGFLDVQGPLRYKPSTFSP